MFLRRVWFSDRPSPSPYQINPGYRKTLQGFLCFIPDPDHFGELLPELIMKEFLTRFLNQIGQAFWIEIKTKVPNCVYYFGPFLTEQEAHEEKQGYWEDLAGEGAQGIEMEVKQCRPTQLTISEEDDDATWEPWKGNGTALRDK